jgi:cob(I)alamin adenosyltransferase
MGHRLSRIYTRTGDDGSTGLGDGTRVPKEHLRVEAYGTVDEANSAVGSVLAVQALPPAVRDCLTDVQHDLFDLGGELSIPGHAILSAAHVRRLETLLDRFNARLAPLKDFVLPGGTRAAACAHVARTVCRRAERRVVALASRDTAPAFALRYLNRLSDLLFVLARALNRRAGRGDVLWQQGKNRKQG